ncbi:MAG: recombinase family protein [Chloroflexota bacterium]
MEVDEEEAAIVRQIFAWYIEGATNTQIRRRLHAQGIRSRKGSEYFPVVTLSKILTSECYATGQIETTLEGEVFYIVCPPIITIETWNKAVAVRRCNKTEARNIKDDYLCHGIVYCACGWKCVTRSQVANRSRGYTNVTGVYICQRRHKKPESQPAECAHTIGSLKLDEYVWNVVRGICRNPGLVQAAVEAKLAELEDKHAALENELRKVQQVLREVAEERQWVITQARKGTISETDMELQLSQLQIQEWEYQRQLDEHKAAQATRKQAQILSEWADQYLQDIDSGLDALEVNVENLSSGVFEQFYSKLQAWQFKDKYPESQIDQLKWAILNEKRRVVRTLIDRVIVTKTVEGRQITPILALDIPNASDESLIYGYQSPEYINAPKLFQIGPVELEDTDEYEAQS